MKSPLMASACALSLFLAACGEGQTVAADNREAAATSNISRSDTVHSGMGTVREIRGDQIEISHGPIQSLGWPAMTMTFRAITPETMQGINVADQVAFEFRQSDGSYILSSISKQ